LKYNFSDIEKKWQAFWEQHGTFKSSDDVSKPKYYILDMFPYPSGSGLHVGHLLGYTASDVLARYKRHKGFNVLHPMGWDAFGLPAEQYAIKNKTHPRNAVEQNAASFKSTLQRVGFSYDWSREINTTDPDYYKWTQWIFLKLYEKGLAYTDEVAVNWSPELRAVLANEEVAEQVAKGYTVEKRPLRQWMLRITEYADRLIEDLDLVEWPESVKDMQRNWIGKSEGCELEFNIQNSKHSITVFTTRPDTLFGATYMVISPEHKLAEALTTTEQAAAVKAYQDAAKRKTDLERMELVKEKTGVFTGSYAVNPATGKAIPVWMADYVLATYGTGAIMAVPAHDERDWEFAKKFDLEIIDVIKRTAETSEANEAFTSKDSVVINSSNADVNLNGLGYKEAFAKMCEWAETKGIGKKKINYKLRDWVFSRQRYWGEPIPMKYYMDANGAYTRIQPETDLPLRLPDVESYQPSGTGESPLATITDWLYGEDEHGKFKRETNTMPQWGGSCWYYLRFADPKNSNAFADAAKEKYWMNVDLYIGGTEHAVLHLLYARFWHKVLYDFGLVSTKEPFQRLFNQGMMLGEDSEKMSKSRGNVVTADSVLEKYGADTVRLYEMFLGPLEQVKPWNTQGIEGSARFLGKVWRLVYASEESLPAVSDEPMPSDVLKLMHKTIKKVGEDIDALRMNTAISTMMIFVNDLTKQNCNNRKAVEALLVMLSPFAPHLAEELWQALGHQASIAHEPFPDYDEALTKDDTVTIAVQVSGKLRGTFEAGVDATADELTRAALQVESVVKFLNGKEVVKKIVVPRKLVNLVVK
jgi:leucyl-tRNA synthetase